jgi:hypothetical protein
MDYYVVSSDEHHRSTLKVELLGPRLSPMVFIRQPISRRSPMGMRSSLLIACLMCGWLSILAYSDSSVPDREALVKADDIPLVFSVDAVLIHRAEIRKLPDQSSAILIPQVSRPTDDTPAIPLEHIVMVKRGQQGAWLKVLTLGGVMGWIQRSDVITITSSDVMLETAQNLSSKSHIKEAIGAYILCKGLAAKASQGDIENECDRDMRLLQVKTSNTSAPTN